MDRSIKAGSYHCSRSCLIERIASFVAALALTAAAGLFAAFAPGNGFLSMLGQRPKVEPAPDRVVYVAAPRPDEIPQIAIDRRRTAVTSARPSPRVDPVVPSGLSTVQPNSADSASARAAELRPDRGPRPTTPNTNNALSPRASAGAPVAAAIAGFTRPSEPVRFDSAIGEFDKRFKEGVLSGVLKPPPPTQAEIDAKYREQAFEAIVARAGGVPARTLTPMGSIPVPLPFGGPSKKQRERDRAIFAELQKSVALRQQKADSIAAARKRRADSLAQLADSGRRRNH
jgi:hypothetical protein